MGRNTLAVEYDAEVILTLADALGALNLPKQLVRVSNRKILAGFLDELNLQEVAKEIAGIIDHAEKVTPEKLKSWLDELAIGDERVAQVLEFIEIAGTRADVVEKLTFAEATWFSPEATAAKREAQVAKELDAYRNNHRRFDVETLAEARAAFGEGTTICDVITGEKITL